MQQAAGVGGRYILHQLATAIDYAHTLLAPSQQRLPDSLTIVVEDGIRAWKQDRSEVIPVYLKQASVMAKEMGYL
jgi:hypothetical protein